MTDTNREIKLTGTKVREKLDMVDQILDSSGSIAKKIDGDEGTLGRLVNDPTIADNVEEVTEDLNQFIGTLTNLKTYVGLRGEFDMYSKLSRFYLQVEIQTRSDAGYLVEISKGPRGGYPRTTLEFDPRIDPNNYYRTVEIDDKMRFTFQIMKRFQWATFRYGLKDSTGGAGLDIATAIFGKKLTLQLDVFDPAWNRLPRVKGTAILQMWRNIYILGGVDDALNTPATLPIVAGNIAVPGRIDTMRYGRDYFVGAMLRFDDRDLAALLTVAGGFLSGATGGS